MRRTRAVWGLLLGIGASACGSEGAVAPGADASAPIDGSVRSAADGSGPAAGDAAADAPSTVGKIEHVVLIMQENRSFDHYFGMFPGADGFTLDAQGNPTNCNPDPHLDGGCVPVFHDSTDANSGGPHSAVAFDTCFDNGKMDGFIKNAEGAKSGCANPQDP